jgi:small subunit ribosomal protein S28e
VARGAEKKEEAKSAASDLGTPARVVEIMGRTGVRGEVIQVRCEVLVGRDQGKIIVRNIRGPIRTGDILMLMETTMQASKLSAR